MTDKSNFGLDFVTLRVFRAAVESGSFVGAAEREHLAPSAISRRISELESRLGVMLLRRHDRGVEPTAAGQLLMRHVETIFDVVDMTMADLDSLSQGKSGRVLILANLSTISGQMPKLLRDLSLAHPKIDFRLEQCDSKSAVRAISLGLADIALVTGSIDISNLLSFDFSIDRLVVLLPQEHELAKTNGALKLRDIVPFPYMGLYNDLALQALVRRKAVGLDFHLHEIVNVGGFEDIGRFVSRGLGLSIMPERHASSIALHEQVVLRELDEDWAIRRTKICVKPMGSLSPACKIALQYIHDSRL